MNSFVLKRVNMKNIKKIVTALLLAFVVCFLCSCNFLFDIDKTPLESFTPQTTNTVLLEKPLNQKDYIKPCFDGATPEQEPVRKLEYAQTNQIVRNESDLIDAAMKGRKPIFPLGSEYRVLYNSVLEILNTIILNDMSDYQKVHAIYDYIIYYTSYDFKLLDEFIKERAKVPGAKITGYENAFYLKGVIEDKVAVCDGFSKAFSLMCSIEGIKNVIITGESFSNGNWLPHAWNKVMLNEKWYIVDSTYGNFSVRESEEVIYEYLNHAFFLIADKDVTHKEEGIKSALRYTLDDVKAENEYGFYQKEYIKDYKVLNKSQNYEFNDKVSLGLYVVYINLHDIKAVEIYSELSDVDVKEKYTISNNIFLLRQNVYYMIN